MLVAAYLVGGFLIASVYAVGMLRGRRDRYHRLGFIIPFTVAAIATPIQMAVGDSLARWVYNNEPTKFAAIELVPKTEQRRARDAARPPQLERHGDRRDPDPRPRVVAVRPERRARAPSSRASTRVPGRRAADHPRGQHRAPRVGRHGRARHAAVPALGLVRAVAGCSAATCPKTQVVPAHRRRAPASPR